DFALWRRRLADVGDAVAIAVDAGCSDAHRQPTVNVPAASRVSHDAGACAGGMLDATGLDVAITHSTRWLHYAADFVAAAWIQVLTATVRQTAGLGCLAGADICRSAVRTLSDSRREIDAGAVGLAATARPVVAAQTVPRGDRAGYVHAGRRATRVIDTDL